MISLLTMVKMESSVSTPHCSFVIYLFREPEALPIFVQDFRAFFQKFPLRYELICVMDGNTSEEFWNTLKDTAPENESWQILGNSHFKGRAQSLYLGAARARGEYILFPSLVMATPLGDLFKILQNLLAEPTMAAFWGERYSKKPELMLHSEKATLKLENLFNKILAEKNLQGPRDPLCEIGGLRKSAWNQIQADPLLQKNRGWYAVHLCQKLLQKRGLNQGFLHVHDSGLRPKDFSLWKARWELLRQSVFETL